MINGNRLISDLKTLKTFGSFNNGVIRPAFSEADIESRKWLLNKFQSAGLDSQIDGIGNVFGRSKNQGPRLLIGSHSDTQPTGGWLDGALGVIYALEIARTLNESEQYKHLAVDIVSFQDEEARFIGCLGSRSLIGDLDQSSIDSAIDKNGIKLIDTINSFEYSDNTRLVLETSEYVGFIEAHIEQGAFLEKSNFQIGIVTNISGLRRLKIEFIGEQNHAGTTMMNSRKDASAAFYEFAHTINTEFPKIATDKSVWTIGKVTVIPNAPSIIPGLVEIDFQFRDPDLSQLDKFQALAEKITDDIQSRGKIHITMSPIRYIEPLIMNINLLKNLEESCEKILKGRWTAMPSAAFHDAGIMSKVMPSAMLFIPSIKGISHDFSEDSKEEDIILGCEVLLDAIVSTLKKN